MDDKPAGTMVFTSNGTQVLKGGKIKVHRKIPGTGND
jgi:hypothetical protein